MGAVIKFPDKEFILTCRKCKLDGFNVILNSENPFDIKWFECIECGDVFTLKNMVPMGGLEPPRCCQQGILNSKLQTYAMIRNTSKTIAVI